ncbi:hypothetical protein C8R47DRAFT_1152499 [Mycena vitilis]|nr:hypothetical protein C8R47DRAFT_1152499 [Mycena vitilis]
MLAPSSGGYHPHAQVLWPCLLAMFFQFGLSARSWLDESPFYTISPDGMSRVTRFLLIRRLYSSPSPSTIPNEGFWVSDHSPPPLPQPSDPKHVTNSTHAPVLPAGHRQRFDCALSVHWRV